MNYSESIDFLYGLRLFGAKFGLENTFRLAELAGNPQASLPFIHVAGTNGKGSTCAMLESIYRASGLRVGLFTSPHLVRFGERIQVDRQCVSDAEVVRLASACRAWIEHFPPHSPPTFFEAITVMALKYFAEQRCDLVVWETGLGGRLDATNIVDPLASVITNVQFDHQQWLGDTLAQIAAEKAGIIKPGRPVITAAVGREPLEVITQRAARLGAPLRCVTPEMSDLPPLDRLNLPLRGAHQKLNAALALAAVDCLKDRLPVTPSAIESGLLNVRWPGRFQWETTATGQSVLLDGAHNPGGAETLRDAIKLYFPERKPTLILGILKDKDWKAICRILAPLAGRLLLVPVASERSASPELLHPVCREINSAAETLACASLAEAWALSRNDPLIVVAGSLYLIGEALEYLKFVPGEKTGERGLNEWSATPRNASQPHLVSSARQ
jgi:dihydrofolate synthase / folylpolyglutamate synthase